MSLDALTGAVTGWPLVVLVLSYAVCPYAVLWLAVRLWPKDHPRRSELLAEYDSVDIWMRPIWVGDVAPRCLLDGLSARWSGWWSRHDVTGRAFLGAVVLAGSALGGLIGWLSPPLLVGLGISSIVSAGLALLSGPLERLVARRPAGRRSGR